MAKKKKAKAKASAKRATSRRSPAREDAISLPRDARYAASRSQNAAVSVTKWP